ncbi:hypothetical protein [Frankia tisae]|uniref:hypothetical protein n=1 Tax=Frankia tisae TaxID=2950104 RepID=UPI0021C239E0|nr:hypothetical protein [Frankia tisae]
MSAAAGLAATLDLRFCSRECVLGRFTPGTVPTLLHRHVRFDVSAGAAGKSAAAGPEWLEWLEDEPRAVADDAGDDGPALRALLDALRSPEVFDQLTRTVPAIPGVIGFAPRAARPDPAPWETNRADPAEPVESSIEIVWTAATRGAGVLRLAPVRGAGVLEVQFSDLRP